MAIPWKIIIPAMVLLTTSGCALLFDSPPPPLKVPVIAFSDLCQQPSTIFCKDFDQLPPEGSNLPEGIFIGGRTCADVANDPTLHCPEIEAGKLKFIVPSNSGAGGSGTYYVRFADHNGGQSIGPGQEVFIQWKQRFSASFLNTRFEGGGGWKQAIVGAADESSCSSNEIVLQNTNQHGFPTMYHACGQSLGFEQRVGAYDLDLQPGGPGGICSYSYLPNISSGCTKYYPDEWLTYQIAITHGEDGQNSRIRLWVSREGRQSKLAIDYQRPLANHKGFGKMWLLPYHTNKSPNQTHPPGYIWYDQLIISRTQLPDR